jgi:hypothetical protein
MSKVPKPPKRPRIQKRAYKKNTAAQYEALGRFVEAFELMVDETRRISIGILKRDDNHEKLVEVLFHHGALTAKPLFDIMRALMADYFKLPYIKVTEQDRNIFSGVLKEIATHYTGLLDSRNTLLHGTWRVGYLSIDDPKFESFLLDKYKVTKEGLSKEDQIPKNAADLLALADSCHKVRWWLKVINGCLPLSSEHFVIAETFGFRDGKWRLMMRSSRLETLP